MNIYQNILDLEFVGDPQQWADTPAVFTEIFIGQLDGQITWRALYQMPPAGFQAITQGYLVTVDQRPAAVVVPNPRYWAKAPWDIHHRIDVEARGYASFSPLNRLELANAV